MATGLYLLKAGVGDDEKTIIEAMDI